MAQQHHEQETSPFFRNVLFGLYGIVVALLIILTTWGVVRGVYFPEQIEPLPDSDTVEIRLGESPGK